MVLMGKQADHLLTENVRDIVLYINYDGDIVEANKAAEEAYGFDRQELCNMAIQDLRAGVSLQYVLQQITAAQENGAIFETQHRRKDGSTFPIEVSASCITLADERLLLCIIRDISTRKRLEAMEKLLHSVDRLILEDQPSDNIFRHICRASVQEMQFDLAYISMKETDGNLQVKAKAGLANAFLSQSPIRWDDSPEGRGPTGTAIRTGEVCVTPVNKNDRYRPLFGHAHQLCIATLCAVPLVVRENILGALTLGSVRPNDFTPAVVENLVAFANQVALSTMAATRQHLLHLQTAILDSVANAVLVSDITGVITWINPAFTSLTGYAMTDAIGKTPKELIGSGYQNAEFYRHLWQTLRSGQVWRGELINRRKDGGTYPEEMTITPVLDQDGAIMHYVAIKQDISYRKQQEEKLLHLALHDPLTNLLNRKALHDRLQTMVVAARSGVHGAILLLDLDDFKFVNDTLGYSTGDELLVLLARRLALALKSADVLVRLGGDEFAALISNCSLNDATATAEAIRNEVELVRVGASESTYAPTASIGVAPINGQLDSEEVLVLADLALYEAKEQGKNRVVSYQDLADGSHLTRTGVWVSRLKDALRDGKFTLYFQPIVNLTSQAHDHYEALIRLVDGDDIISPGNFLPVAERFGLAPRIDRWVVDNVLSFLRRHQGVRVSVNLSGCSLSDVGFLSDIKTAVHQADLEPGRLTFEVTESSVIHDLGMVRIWMEDLKALGCQFALDDFGKGFSTFSYLRTLPTNYVKIDASLVVNLTNDQTDQALVNAISTVAHSLGRMVVVEGIENDAVLPFLRELGVEYGQGFSLGKPQPFLHHQANRVMS